ncbi:Auxin-responsive SAUR protein family member [Musa troglodytarum]|uniref:Auxin-responsive SAUR protein family member n=1 Tax=Musa troglodytarum TaxID=320322 RepID=A0A9E7G9F3_9LILI|nr:Auxin-responsive SAUR protein family member [Musa troglodytarum]
MIKRWHSSNKITRSTGGRGGSSDSSSRIPPGLHTVYVGKSRRWYLIRSDLAGHPLFRVLVERSGGSAADDSGTVVDCEVVLFEHLLWMLENADPQPESLDEMVDFYSCC